MGMIIVYVTHPGLREAKKIVKRLLESRIIACASIFPVSSSYWWNDRIAHNLEFVSILKTRKENWQRLKSEVKKLHSYSVPCIMKINVEANKDFEEWIASETRRK